MKLYELAHSRTGDKGNISIISVIPYLEKDYQKIKTQLTAERVKEHMRFCVKGDVIRYECDNLAALNFVLYDALGGGVTQSLNLDRHGKSLSFYLLDIEIE